MGVVYDAEDQKLARKVALKFLPDELAGDPDATRRFRREAQTIALLNHPQICTIYEVDEHENRTFIAMERLEGSNLKTHMARKTLEMPEIIDIALQIAQALDAAHSKGVIHRDIKPGNIFISEAGRVKVLDFGLARRIPTEASTAFELEGFDHAGPADRHGQLHGARADSADAAGSALRSVFAGRRDVRDGDGAAALRSRLPRRNRDEHPRKRTGAGDDAFSEPVGAA